MLRDLAGDRTTRFAADLTDSELAGLWNLLKQFWPYQDDGDLWTSGVVGADQQARHWRDGVLETLVLRGTSEAAGLLQQLAESNPDLPWLADQARRAQDLHRQQDWAPLSPGDLTRLLRDSKARLVRDIAELTAVVLEALDTLQEQALWPHGWSMLMWNRADEAASRRMVARLGRQPVQPHLRVPARTSRRTETGHQPGGGDTAEEHRRRQPNPSNTASADWLLISNRYSRATKPSTQAL